MTMPQFDKAPNQPENPAEFPQNMPGLSAEYWALLEAREAQIRQLNKEVVQLTAVIDKSMAAIIRLGHTIDEIADEVEF